LKSAAGVYHEYDHVRGFHSDVPELCLRACLRSAAAFRSPGLPQWD